MHASQQRENNALSGRRSRPIIAAILAGLVIIGGWWAVGGESSSGLLTRTAQAGDVTVKATPVAIGPAGAVFTVTLVSASFDLDFAIEKAARLVVDGTEWRPATWDEGLPSAHGRDGRLEFRSAGPARHRAELRIDDLPEAVLFTWNL